jgi:hypothetical protein
MKGSASRVTVLEEREKSNKATSSMNDKFAPPPWWGMVVIDDSSRAQGFSFRGIVVSKRFTRFRSPRATTSSRFLELG